MQGFVLHISGIAVDLTFYDKDLVKHVHSKDQGGSLGPKFLIMVPLKQFHCRRLHVATC